MKPQLFSIPDTSAMQELEPFRLSPLVAEGGATVGVTLLSTGVYTVVLVKISGRRPNSLNRSLTFVAAHRVHAALVSRTDTRESSLRPSQC